MARRTREGCEIDMTPMIDVVFQLIIFFIVTIQMEKNYKEEIQLEDAPHGDVINSREGADVTAMTVEVDRRGDLSMNGVPLTERQLKGIMINRYKARGQFPILVRGDKRTRHRDIRRVMDICTGIGLWKINFVAIKERKATD